MSKIDFVKIIFFFPVFPKNKKINFKKLFNRCIFGAKNICFKNATFLEIFGWTKSLDIYLDIFQLCQNVVFLMSFSFDFSTHKCRDPNLQNIFDTAQRGVSKKIMHILLLQNCREKSLQKIVEKTRF